MTLLEHLNKVPPIICRLYARTGKCASTCRDIAKSSGLSYNAVARISLKKDWETVHIDTASAFLKGCGIEYEKLASVPLALRHLANAPDPLPHIRERIKSRGGSKKSRSLYYSKLLTISAQVGNANAST